MDFSLCHGLVLNWGWRYENGLKMASSVECQGSQDAEKAEFTSTGSGHQHQNHEGRSL